MQNYGKIQGEHGLGTKPQVDIIHLRMSSMASIASIIWKNSLIQMGYTFPMVG